MQTTTLDRPDLRFLCLINVTYTPMSEGGKIQVDPSEVHIPKNHPNQAQPMVMWKGAGNAGRFKIRFEDPHGSPFEGDEPYYSDQLVTLKPNVSVDPARKYKYTISLESDSSVFLDPSVVVDKPIP